MGLAALLKPQRPSRFLDASRKHYAKAREGLDELARQVVSLSGDGGFTMMMGEFISLTQLGLPVKIIVFNSGSLGFVAMEMKVAGFIDTGTDLKNPDFAAMATAMGVTAFRVENSDYLESALTQALAHPGTVLVDVVVTGQELVMPPSIRLSQAKGFGLYVLKAVMNAAPVSARAMAAGSLGRAQP